MDRQRRSRRQHLQSSFDSSTRRQCAPSLCTANHGTDFIIHVDGSNFGVLVEDISKVNTY